MHLEHRCTYSAAGFYYESQANPWVVIDDYGIEHDSLQGRTNRDEQALQLRSKRFAMLSQENQDPEFFRISHSRPRFHRINESMSFSSPIGLSMEVDLDIQFQVHPHWDQQAGDAHYERDRGARMEILFQSACIGQESTNPVVLAAAEVEEFCWQYIELQRARELAEARAAQEAAR